ncbi:sialate O-acetylesterase [Roseibacillus persicicus]|nr:sialate O-acetylesterase [Roseibacillus persicicus]
MRSLFLSFLLFGVSDSFAEPVKVYLLGGQSNMQGSGTLGTIEGEYPNEIPGCQFHSKKGLVPYQPGKIATAGNVKRFGPELGMALQLTESEKPAVFIKYALGGMPLHPGWDGNKWLGEPVQGGRRNFFPGLTAEDPKQGALYQNMLQEFRDGLAAVKAAGDEPVVAGFFWMQGEQDSKHETSATSYAQNLALLRDRLQADLGLTDKLPLVFGQVLPHEPALARFTHRDEVRQQMAHSDQNSGTPEAIPMARMVSTDGFSLLKDTVHYDSKGQMQLGKAFLTGLRSLDSDQVAD